MTLESLSLTAEKGSEGEGATRHSADLPLPSTPSTSTVSPLDTGSEVPRGEVTAEKGSEEEGVQHHTATLPKGLTPPSTKKGYSH